jgi:tetratricopeptide (TPR) repeat protein
MLKLRRDLANRGAAHTPHLAQKLLRERESVGIDAIAAHQQPSRTPLLDRTDYATLLFSLGRRSEARDVCRRAIELKDVKPGAERYFRGLAYYLLGRQSDAETAYQESKSSESYYDVFAKRLPGIAQWRTSLMPALHTRPATV